MTKTDPEKQRLFAIEIVRKLRAAGYQAYWVGGCVRDLLLGKVPKDYDVATDATPEQVRKLFGRRHTFGVGAAFGVILVVGPRGSGQFDVATFREDLSYTDGRRPDEVRYSTPEEDARRRDFTINGLFYDPMDQRVIDYVGGEEDLQNKRIRAIGEPEQRIAEDKLRMLRAVRFTATFRFQLDPLTLRAVQQHADEIHTVSVERISGEMQRMLEHPTRVYALELLLESNLLAELLPELWRLADSQAATGLWQTTLEVLEKLQSPSFAVALAAALHQAVDSRSASEIAARWKLSNDDANRLVWLLEHYRQVPTAENCLWSEVQPLLATDRAEELVQLAAAIYGDQNAGVRFCREKLRLPRPELDPPPLVSGNDLIAQGIEPGVAFKELLSSVRNAQLDGQIHSPAEAMELVEQLLKQRGS